MLLEFTPNDPGDSAEFCKMAALNARVGFAPGVAFGKGGEGMVRLCYAREKTTHETAINRL